MIIQGGFALEFQTFIYHALMRLCPLLLTLYHPAPLLLSKNKWIKKMWYIYTMEYYSTIKKNEIMLFVGKWMEPENMLSKVNRAQKVKGGMFLWKLEL
jgi:hypothetical protein